eukprot:c18030_g1_i1.p2 GENE.c18030_g1_i1~~c18030_g1_i1.p2  ORF type:complete len:133 (-),score=16.78 c18030_g1_i1:55-453(-)
MNGATGYQVAGSLNPPDSRFRQLSDEPSKVHLIFSRKLPKDPLKPTAEHRPRRIEHRIEYSYEHEITAGEPSCRWIKVVRDAYPTWRLGAHLDIPNIRGYVMVVLIFYRVLPDSQVFPESLDNPDEHPATLE